MAKTITFSFTSSEFEGTEATETFTFEELEIDEKLDGIELDSEVKRIHEAWIWHKLNISYSIVIEELDTPFDNTTRGIKDEDKKNHQ